uniref:Ig domain-containing protein n=1 Tax=Agrobacterium rosae TaxID=1972867 RepID=A0AAW9FHC6_9HYPH|nr:putative Ig domain-containing protein [Agrobacterium rosae]MDX8306017.1 putative Ig domain-containing protein [Agrobacterium rosae]
MQPAHGTLTFSGQSGSGTETVTYTHNGDTATSDAFPLEDEEGDTITVNITINPSRTASIAVSPSSRNEDSGASFTYTVTLSQTSSSATTVNLTHGGTATSGTDYTGAPTSIVVPANATSASFAVTPVADTVVEVNETVVMSVTSGSGYGIGSPSSATATIVNDDLPNATIAVSPASVAEDGATNLIYTVTLDQATPSAVSVAFSVGGTATSGTDYAAVSSPLVIAAGQTTGTITINPTADATIEPDETVVLALASGTGYNVASPNSATGTILNDDQPTLSINDVSVNEGNAGNTNATFTVSLNQPAGAGGVSFDIATADGTATAGVDYVASSLTGQTIPAGSSSATFTVLVNGDTLSEPNETFFVNVSNVTGASVGDSQGQGTIVNDDALPALSIDDVSVNEGNSGTTTATFTVSLSAASGQTVSVDYATANGTATAGSDYVARSGTLTFAPGVTAQGVAITVNGDTAVEPNETFSLGLSGASNASIARATGTGTIVNDDVVVTVGPASLPAATAGSAYSQTLSASGGTAPYSFAVTAGALPSGLTLSAAGVLSGTPTASGSFNFTATATESGGSPTNGNRAYTLTVAVATTTLPATSLPAGTAGQSYSSALNPATGGVTPYTYAVTAGALPPGIALNASSGTLTGTPGSVGSFTFSVTATDSTTGTPSQATRVYTLTIAAPPIVVAPSTLPVATRGTAYGQTLSASGATAPYTYALASGTLPAGITLASTGTLSGTATVEGTFNFTVTATDAGSFTGNRAYSLTVAGPNLVLPASTLLVGTAGQTYSGSITPANGGTAPYSYALTGGSLPTGVVVDAATGALSGVPTVAGTFTFTLTVSDSTPSPAAQASRSYTLTVAAPGITISPSSLANATRGTAYSQTLTASGGASPYSYAITGGTLPAGLTLNSSGVLSGTPTADGTFNFTVAATDANIFTATQAYTLIVAVPELVLPAGNLSAGTAGQAYSAIIAPATGGTAPYTYNLASGNLPTGITVDAATGGLNGTPTNSGTFTFSLRVTDSSIPVKQVTQAYTLAIAPPIVAFNFAPAAGSLKDAMAGEEYDQQITATGGVTPFIYSISAGSLPPGLILNVSTGELTGTVASSADVRSYAFTVQVRDNNGSTGEASYTIGVKSRSVDATDKEVVVPPGSTPNNVDLTRGATGGPFTGANIASIEPSNAGTFSIVRGEFAQASPPTSLGWYLKYIPNPSYSGEVSVGFTLTSALGVSDIATVTYKVGYDAAQVEREISGLVHNFVSRRQDMISSNIYVPGLLDRRQIGQANEPVSVQIMPSENGMTANFSTSLAQMEAARDRVDGIESSASSNLFNIWMDGAFLAHNDKDINGGKWGRFAMLNVGTDYLINEKALIGLSFHYDHMTNPTVTDAELIGNGWLAGPYASLEIGRNVFWNASLRYGGSSNDIDTTFWDGTFDTSRWMADTTLEGQWSLQNGATIIPKLRAVYFSETVGDYTVKNSAGDEIGIEGFNEEQFRVSLGAEIAKSFDMSNGMKMEPKLGVTGGFSGLDGSGAFAQVATGVSLETDTFWMFDASLLFNADGEGGKSVGGRLRASKQF